VATNAHDARLLTVAEVARALAVSPKTVRRRIASGELAAVRLGRGPKAPVRVDPDTVAGLLVETSPP
jgi:excisionase family DNA binding protein